MNTENLHWAFFSRTHKKEIINHRRMLNKETTHLKDVYYRIIPSGTWVETTALFSCIEMARSSYDYMDAIYLGPVDITTKQEFPTKELTEEIKE